MYYLLLSLWLTQAEVEAPISTNDEYTPVQDQVESAFTRGETAESNLKKEE